MDKSAQSNIQSISIRNFKSVRSVTLSDCRRINVLIGRPNVGKSNILEALALFDVPYMVNTSGRSLKSLVRIENTADLFHNGVSAVPVEVVAGGEPPQVRPGYMSAVVRPMDCPLTFPCGTKCPDIRSPHR